MGLIETFKKQGGMKLLKQYWQSGAFFTAVVEFMLLGKSRTALEILRLSAELKTKQKLENKYGKKLKQFDREYKEQKSRISNKVWVCWFQGMENAPKLVKRCYQSLRENLTDREIVLITSENMMEYVQFPEFIVEKWKSGVITYTHMTDLLRLELLIRYGGMWVDATVFCSRKREEIPEYYFNSDLFFYQCLKPGRDGHSSYISSWLMNARSSNRILMATQHLIYEYWKDYKEMLDYFLLHDFMAIVLDYYSEEWKDVIPVDNAAPHILLLRLFDEFDPQLWEAAMEQTPFHKLSYKLGKDEMELKNTYYSEIIRCGQDNRGGVNPCRTIYCRTAHDGAERTRVHLPRAFAA